MGQYGQNSQIWMDLQINKRKKFVEKWPFLQEIKPEQVPEIFGQGKQFGVPKFQKRYDDQGSATHLIKS